MKTTLVEAQRLLLGILTSVEAGLTTPEEAVEEFKSLKENAPAEFKAEFTLEDFQKVAKTVQSVDFESSTPVFESSFSSSY